MKTLVGLLPVICLSLFSFRPLQQEFCRRQGLKGHVYLVRGNQMPSPDRPSSQPPGMKTTLYIYELTNLSQVSRDGAFYKSISTRLIKEVKTDQNGYFKIKLPPGQYSLFVKKDDLFYSSVFDDKNNIHPVEVRKGEWKEENFQANWGAVY